MKKDLDHRLLQIRQPLRITDTSEDAGRPPSISSGQTIVTFAGIPVSQPFFTWTKDTNGTKVEFEELSNRVIGFTSKTRSFACGISYF